MSALLTVEDLVVRFPVTRGMFRAPAWLTAVDGVSLELDAGEALGIVGESGCGKSTLGRAILRLVRPSSGIVRFDGIRIDALSQRALRPLRRDLQVVFQDPVGSLNPRLTVGQIVAEPLVIAERAIGSDDVRRRVAEAMERVGLGAALANRYPHEFSGGQCQRIGIARAMITRPRLIVCDEPVSALDVSVQGQVVNLLADLQRDLGLAYLFISHNLAVVRHVAARVMVLYLGRVMEEAPRERLYSAPLHPYTRALLDAVPTADPGVERARSRATLGGDLPSPLDPPSGCVFRTRCPLAIARCAGERPSLEPAGQGHRVACHRWRDWPQGLHGPAK